MTSLAQIREQLRNRNRKTEEVDRVDYVDQNGFTSSFPLAGRRKYEMIMRAVGYVEYEDYREIAQTGKGFFCASCNYFAPKLNSSTGYTCTKYLFDDRQEGCCGGWERKDENPEK